MNLPETYPVLSQIPVLHLMIHALLPEEWFKGANKAVKIRDLAGFECLLDNEVVVSSEDLFCEVTMQQIVPGEKTAWLTRGRRPTPSQ